jgi:hypothetical protein
MSTLAGEFLDRGGAPGLAGIVIDGRDSRTLAELVSAHARRGRPDRLGRPGLCPGQVPIQIGIW